MGEQSIFEAESTRTTAEVAALFHHLGDCLRDDSRLAFQRDDRSITLSVPSEVSVSVEVEREADDGREETEVEIELEWDAEADSAETELEDESDRRPDVNPITPAVEPDDAPPASLGRFEVYRDRADEWRWRLVHRNGNIIATSGEGYTSRQNAEKGLRSVMSNAPSADVTTERS